MHDFYKSQRVGNIPHNEFAYNRNHSITSHLHFEIVYGFKPLTPLDLCPFLLHKTWCVVMKMKEQILWKNYMSSQKCC